ncbi:MAG: glycosyltransferase [Planctomycetes bacterium]|nr:glycosyltransferase [Planctomycetota bacterium]
MTRTSEQAGRRTRASDDAAPAPEVPAGTRLLFLTTEGFAPTVHDAQVLDLLRALDGVGLRFDLMVMDPLLLRTLLDRAGRARLRRLASAVPGRLVVRPYVPFEDRAGAPVARLLLRRHLRGQRPALVHARGLWAAYAALGAARRLPRGLVRVVYDARGDHEAEHAFHVAGRGDARDRRVRPGLARIRRAEAIVCRRAARVLCVSDALRDVLEARHPGTAAKADVIPCGVDDLRFRPDPAARAAARQRLGLGDKFVVCYAGALGPYHLPEQVVRAGAVARRVRHDAHLLLVTPEVERGRALAAAVGLGPDAATVVAASHDEVPALLNAADVGLLLRREDPVNAVASPTKLAEYLACGLPVIVSDGIGDASALVREERVGEVVRDVDDPVALERALRRLIDEGPSRRAVAVLARARLARSAFLDVYRRVYAEAAAP